MTISFLRAAFDLKLKWLRIVEGRGLAQLNLVSNVYTKL
jgi:hypothetical protein